SNIFAMSPSTYQLPWHRDEYNDVIECSGGAQHCSVQINLTDASPANCVAVIPGSHRWDADALRERGYRAAASGGDANTPVYEVPPDARTVDVPLRAGEFYVFHPRLLHSSLLRSAGAAEVDDADSVRLSITLRIATSAVKVLPSAFAGTPARAACVLLSGTSDGTRNPLGAWAA